MAQAPAPGDKGRGGVLARTAQGGGHIHGPPSDAPHRHQGEGPLGVSPSRKGLHPPVERLNPPSTVSQPGRPSGAQRRSPCAVLVSPHPTSSGVSVNSLPPSIWCQGQITVSRPLSTPVLCFRTSWKGQRWSSRRLPLGKECEGWNPYVPLRSGSHWLQRSWVSAHLTYTSWPVFSTQPGPGLLPLSFVPGPPRCHCRALFPIT